MENIKNQLEKVTQSLAVQNSTISHELTTDESKLASALTERKIRFISEEELKQLMLFVYALVGLRGENYPKGLDKDFLHTYVRENYGGHTVSEIRLAFTMAIQNKLGVDATAFEYFTVAYFTKIVDAYRKWAVETLHSQPAILPKPALPTISTSDAEFIEAVKKVYFLKKDWRTIPELAYDVLVDQLGLNREAKKQIAAQLSALKIEVTKEACKQFAVAQWFDKQQG